MLPFTAAISLRVKATFTPPGIDQDHSLFVTHVLPLQPDDL